MDAPGTQPVDPYRDVSAEAIASGGIASTMEQGVLDFSRCRHVSDFADKAKPLASVAVEALRIGRDVDYPFGMNPLHWACAAADSQAFQVICNSVSRERIISLFNEPNGARSVDEIAYEVAGKVGPAINSDCPDQILVFLLNNAPEALRAEYYQLFKSIKALLTPGDLKGQAANNTGNNRFNLAAGGREEVVRWYCDMFRADPDYQIAINHPTNAGVRPLHHAGRSEHPERVKVFALLLAEGAWPSLENLDDRGNSPLDHLQPDDRMIDQIMGYVEEYLGLSGLEEAERQSRLKTIEFELIAAFERFEQGVDLTREVALGKTMTP
ncbi:hypothetical protein [Salinisphaera sp. G21_0]|uniref:hypothetical protein n=1 Tax=Salinisphaera sp. G21_0 TaxID=2821094 RepID=UPI001AD9E5A3|nr:hypothetical protein [Salinisphaera sp. G21_0]MBO9482627.1 hypothetical protein [Salinisphaera sp. G21_0]